MKTHLLRFGFPFPPRLPFVLAPLLAGAIPSGPASAGCIDYGQYAHWEDTFPTPAEAVDVAVRGSKAYVLTSELVVLDISDPQHLRQIGSVSLPEGQATGIAAGDYGIVLVTAGTSLYIIDATIPQNPAIVGTTEIPSGNPADVEFDQYGSYAIVLSSNFGSGIYVYDLWDLTAPQLVGSVIFPDQALSMVVSRGCAYVAEWRDYASGVMRIVSLSNPSNPSLLGSVSTSPNPKDVAVSANHAFVCTAGGITIVNVANPASPYITGGVPAVGSASCIGLSGSKAFVGTHETSWTLDVTDPLHPQAFRGVGLPYYATKANLAGNLAYVTVGEYGLYVVDVTHPETAPIMGNMAAPGYTYGAVQDSVAYLAGGVAFTTVDVSDPGVPRALGSVNLSRDAQDVAVSGSYAYVVENDYPDIGQLQVIDAVNPASPSIVGTFVLDGFGMGVAVVWPYAYVADYTGLNVIDVTTPEHPVRVGHVALANYAYDVAVSGTRAYVAVYIHGLQVVDISDPVNPQVVGDRYILYGGDHVAVNGGYVFLTNHAGLKILDGSGGYIVRGSLSAAATRCVAAEDGRTYLASYGIQIVDASDVTQPVFAGTAYVSTGWDFAVSDSYVYECGGERLRAWSKPCLPADGTDMEADPGQVARLDLRVCPNPAATRVEVRFEAPAAGAVKARIYSVGGRLVRTLLDGPIGAGGHVLLWDGRDGVGRSVASGIYVARVATDDGSAATRQVLMLR